MSAISGIVKLLSRMNHSFEFNRTNTTIAIARTPAD
jgi:hypothetical protein